MTENGSISYWGCPHCLSWDSEESPGKNFCLSLWSMIKVYQLNIQTTLTWKTVINISYSLLMISSSSIKLRNIYLQWPICDTRDQSQCAPRPHVWNHHLISSVLWTVQCLHALTCGPTPAEAGLNNIPFQRQGKQVLFSTNFMMKKLFVLGVNGVQFLRWNTELKLRRVDWSQCSATSRAWWATKILSSDQGSYI